MKEIEVLRGKEEKFRKQIAKFSDADPEVIAELNKKIKVLHKKSLHIYNRILLIFGKLQ